MNLSRRDLLKGSLAAGTLLALGCSPKREKPVVKETLLHVRVIEGSRRGESAFNPSVSDDGHFCTYFEGKPQITMESGEEGSSTHYVINSYDTAKLKVIDRIKNRDSMTLSPPPGWTWDARITPTLTSQFLAVPVYKSIEPGNWDHYLPRAIFDQDYRPAEGAIAVYDLERRVLANIVPMTEGHQRHRVREVKSSGDYLVAVTKNGLVDSFVANAMTYNFRTQQLQQFAGGSGGICLRYDRQVDCSGSHVAFARSELVHNAVEERDEHKDTLCVMDARTGQVVNALELDSSYFLDDNAIPVVRVSGDILFYATTTRENGRQYGVITLEDGIKHLNSHFVHVLQQQGRLAPYSDVDVNQRGNVFTVNQFEQRLRFNGQVVMRPAREAFTDLIVADETETAVFGTKTDQKGETDQVYVVSS
ncbi:twin-arginine translocation signal domain-containing protein [Candidatus Woesearchaeota archaeon]|nr:twin-arginine translocation signal domain-containing protein [Candidatus Woesearchaeota archaeon]